MNPVGRHDAHRAGQVPDLLSFKHTYPLTGQDIMDLDHACVGVVTDRGAGIDPDMVQRQAPAGIRPGCQVAQRNAGKLRVRVPWECGHRMKFLIAGNRVMTR